jgi:hypothetical protein
VTMECNIMPNEKISTFSLYFMLFKISGAQ